MDNEITKVDDKPTQIQVAPDAPPMVQIAQMMQSGVKIDVDQMAKLQELSERYEANEARKAYHVAMASFKEDPPIITKDQKVEYGQTRYKHASLSNVTTTINKALAGHGLSASWEPDQKDGMVYVTCRITHRAGHSEQATLFAPPDDSGKKNKIQQIASTVSYLERYTILALTGLSTGEMDDDGNGGPNVDAPPAIKPMTDKERVVLEKLALAMPPKEGFVVNITRIGAIFKETNQKWPTTDRFETASAWLLKYYGDSDLYEADPNEQSGHFGDEN